MRRAAALVLAVTIAGCGAASTRRAPAATTTSAAPISAAPSTTAGPATLPATATTIASRPPIEVTAADAGRVLRLQPGDTVEVVLHTGELWSEPMSSNDAVVYRVSGGVNATTGDATAMFSAVSSGSATLTSQRRCLPRAGHLCGQYIALWKVTVSVA